MLSTETLTLYELLSLIISILGFVSVIVSLAFLIRQTRLGALQTKSVADTLTSTNYTNIANVMFGADQLFINYPELRSYFYDGKDINEASPDYPRVAAIAEYMLDYFGYVLIQSKNFPQLWPPNWWTAYMEEVFANSPVICKYLHKTRAWYNAELYDLMVKSEQLLSTRSPMLQTTP